MAVDFLVVSKVLSSLTCSSALSSRYMNSVPNMSSATTCKSNLNGKTTLMLVCPGFLDNSEKWQLCKMFCAHGQGRLTQLHAMRQMLAEQIRGLCMSFLSELQVHSSCCVPWTHCPSCLCVTGHMHPYSQLRFPNTKKERRREGTYQGNLLGNQEDMI